MPAMYRCPVRRQCVEDKRFTAKTSLHSATALVAAYEDVRHHGQRVEFRNVPPGLLRHGKLPPSDLRNSPPLISAPSALPTSAAFGVQSTRLASTSYPP